MNLPKIMSYLLIFTFFLFIVGCGGGKQVKQDEFKTGNQKDMYGAGVKTVTAEGLAEVRGAGEPEAYDRAEQAALKKAIENALGTIIDATTIADSGVVLEQTIYAKQKGYIRNYQVTSKRVEDGIAYVNITAQVGMQELKDDVMGLNIMQNRMNMPKTLIITKEIYNNTPLKQKTAYNILAKKFSDKQFTIISPTQISPNLKNNLDNLYNLMEGDENLFISAAAKIGMDVNSDIVVVGKIEAQAAQPIQGYDTGMLSSQADADFKVVNVGDGRIIATAHERGAGAHITAESAGISAIERTSDPAADDMLDQIIKGWEDVLNNGNLITLTVKGLSLTDEIKFANLMKMYIRQVKDVFQKQRNNDTSVYTVKYLGLPKDLANSLVTKQNFPYQINVLKYDFGMVSVSAIKK